MPYSYQTELQTSFIKKTPICYLVPTKRNPLPKDPRLVAKNPHHIPKNPRKCTKKPPKCTKKAPFVPIKNPTELARMDPHETNMHQQKHPFCQKIICLPCVRYTCGPLCTKKPTWLPLSLPKNHSMGYLGVSSFTPLSTTFRSTIRSVFFGVKIFPCSCFLPFLRCHLPSAIDCSPLTAKGTSRHLR